MAIIRKNEQKMEAFWFLPQEREKLTELARQQNTNKTTIIKLALDNYYEKIHHQKIVDNNVNFQIN